MKKFRSQMTKVLLGIGVFLLCFCAAFSVKADAAEPETKVDLQKALQQKELVIAFKNPSRNSNQYYCTGKNITPEVIVSYKVPAEDPSGEPSILSLKQGADIDVNVTTGKGIGTYAVTIKGVEDAGKKAGSVNFRDKVFTGSVKLSYDIIVKSPTIKFNMSTIRLKKKQSTSLFRVTGLAVGDYVKGYKSSNTRIFVVDRKGKVTAKKKKGSAYLYVTLASGKVGKAKVIVQNGTVKTTKVSANTYNLKLAKGQSYTLTASKYPLTSRQSIKFYSSNKKIATVTSSGKVIAKQKGSCKIYVKSGSKKKTVKVSVLANSVPKGDGNLYLSVCRNISNQILADGNWIYSNSGTKNTYKDARAASRRATNCAHFVSICAQEFGGLNKGQKFYGNKDGEIKANSSTMAVLKANYEIINVGKKPFPTVQHMLQPGDICIWVGQHTNVYAGKDANGNMCWFDAGGDMTADGKHDSGPFSRLYKTASYKKGRLSYIIRVKNKMAN